MSMIMAADLHLVDDPNQDYRFGLFPWLRERIRRYKVDHFMILGDLTEEKDRHSSILVNRITRELARIAKNTQVAIVRGNHDGFDPNTPFFEFMKRIPNIRYIKKATFDEAPLLGHGLLSIGYLPHSRHPQQDYAGLEYDKIDYLFMHQTVDGALGENGMNLSGIPRGTFRDVRKKVFSGDIHTPQQVGKVTYVGSPYHVHFGDKFDARCMLLNDDGSTKDLHFPSPRKHMLKIRSMEEIKNYQIPAGDHVKVVVQLRREDYPDYDRIRAQVYRTAEKHGWNLFGVSLKTAKVKQTNGEAPAIAVIDPQNVVTKHCEQENLEKSYRVAGLWYVKEDRSASTSD